MSDKKDCGDCVHVTTPKGKQCYTMTRRLDELITSKNLAFVPEHVIPALDKIANECSRYETKAMVEKYSLIRSKC